MSMTECLRFLCDILLSLRLKRKVELLFDSISDIFVSHVVVRNLPIILYMSSGIVKETTNFHFT